MASVGALDVVAPSGPDQAKAEGWPLSAEDAATRTLNSELFAPTKSLLGTRLHLDRGRSVGDVSDASDSTDAQDRGTEFQVLDGQEDEVGVIVVGPVGFGAFGAQVVMRCAR